MTFEYSRIEIFSFFYFALYFFAILPTYYLN
ncbi:MAG: hypothetical protein ACJAWV_003914 [Flammeovirgaceae bacterium]|jgi:hypothetical protein